MEHPFLSITTGGKTFSVSSLKPYKHKDDNYWTVTADFRALETFTNCESNYDVVDRLKKFKVLTETAQEDSEYCQFFAYFKTKKTAESFLKRLSDYVEFRKNLIQSL
jgi:hypothetical protein